MQYKANLEFYSPRLRERWRNLFCKKLPADICDSGKSDAVVISEIGKEVRPVHWRKSIAIINFDDVRRLDEIARDFSEKYGDGSYGEWNNTHEAYIPVSQRGIIKEIFVQYFNRNSSF